MGRKEKQFERTEDIEAMACKSIKDAFALARRRTQADCTREGVMFEIRDKSAGGGIKYAKRAKRLFDMHYDDIINKMKI